MARVRLSEPVIIDAAATLIEQQGLENLTVGLLADSLGVKASSLYNHISGINDVLMGLAKRALNQLEEAIRDTAIGRSGADALYQMAVAYRRFVLEYPQLYNAFIRLASQENTEIEITGHSIAQIIHQVLANYHGTLDDHVHFVRAYRSALHGFVTMEAAGFFHAAQDKDESFFRLMTAVISSLQERT